MAGVGEGSTLENDKKGPTWQTSKVGAAFSKGPASTIPTNAPVLHGGQSSQMGGPTLPLHSGLSSL